MNHIQVIDGVFFRLETLADNRHRLTVSKPGRIEDTIYIPPESVTIESPLILLELLNFATTAKLILSQEMSSAIRETQTTNLGTTMPETTDDGVGEDTSDPVHAVQGEEL